MPEVKAYSPTRRTLLTGFAASVLLPKVAAAASSPAAPIPPAPAASSAAEAHPEPIQMSGDYAHERRKFRTDLLNKGPAPDNYEPLVAPPEAEQILYKAGYGGELELVAWVSRYDRKTRSRPAVLFLHGGNAIGQGHWPLMKPYIDAGYVVMIPSLRGENGQKGNFSGFYDEVFDVLAASDRLRHLPGVDPHRMFIAGHSIGGTLAMLAAMSTKRFRAAAPISGDPDAFAFFDRYPQDIRFDDRNPREFQMRSAICYAHSFKCPLKLMYGAAETHAPPRLALLAKRARAAGIDVEVAELPGNHFSAIPAEIEQSIQFFKSVAA
jgi:dipeptidyl aminopeptidase/acylaminoacyl peptidase